MPIRLQAMLFPLQCSSSPWLTREAYSMTCPCWLSIAPNSISLVSVSTTKGCEKSGYVSIGDAAKCPCNFWSRNPIENHLFLSNGMKRSSNISKPVNNTMSFQETDVPRRQIEILDSSGFHSPSLGLAQRPYFRPNDPDTSLPDDRTHTCLDRIQTISKCSRCSSKLREYTMISSRYIRTICQFRSPRTAVTSLWKVAGAPFNPNGIVCIELKQSHAAFGLSSSLTLLSPELARIV